MNRRFIIGAGAALTLLTSCLYASFSAEAAPRGAECQLKGNAPIRPGLTQAAKTQAITLTGVTVSGCRSGNSTSPNTTVLSGSVTTSPNPVYATASCASGKLVLTATI